MAGRGRPGLWLFLAIVVVISIGLALGSIWLARRSGMPEHGTGYNASLSPFLTTVGLVYGALLSFTVVVAWEQFSCAEVSVTTESSTLAAMYRQTGGMPPGEQGKLRQLLRTYTTAVQDEWDPQKRNRAAQTARGAITDMYWVLGNQGQPAASNPISGDFMGQLTPRGLLLFIVFWLDHPFGHQLGVTPAPFQHSLEVFDGVDRDQ